MWYGEKKPTLSSEEKWEEFEKEEKKKSLQQVCRDYLAERVLYYLIST